MNIAHIVFGMTTGGIETMLINIANYQRAMGHNIAIFVINDLVDRKLISSFDNNIHIKLINRPVGSKNPLHIFRFNHALGLFKPDVVHIHKANIINYLFPKFRHRTCLTQHEIIVAEDLKPISKLRKIFSISEAVCKDLSTRTGINSIVVLNGIKVESFKKSTTIYRCGQPLRCVCAGRLEHLIKGQHILIYAIKQLIDRGITDINLDIIGTGSSLEFLKKIVNDNKLENHIKLPGQASQEWLHQNLCRYDLFILPSLQEGFGLTVAEAMSANIPVLVSNLPGPCQIIENGLFGLKFKAGDPLDCADKIESIYRNGIEHGMLQRAATRVNDFDVSITAKKYIELYE